MIRYLRIHLFYKLMRPFSRRTRELRMRWFLDFLASSGPESPRILDLGGDPGIWESVERPLDVTILNLPGSVRRVESARHRFTYIEGDGCDVRQFGDRQFDVVFSNSVIEHVGDPTHQEAFACEVRRLGERYWVQTPSPYFPIEAHCGMPGWWFYPDWLRRAFLKHWRPKLPAWTEYIEATRVLTRSDLRRLFPQGEFRTERVLGFTKSYIVHST